MKIVLFLLSFCLMLSCQTKKTISFNTLKHTERKALFCYKNCQADSINCTYLRLSYPYFDKNNQELDSFLNHQIQQVLLQRPDSGQFISIDAMRDSLFKEYEAFKKDIPDSELPFTEEINITVEGGKDSLLSLECLHYYYQGGAHGSTVIKRRMFDLAKREVLTPHHWIQLKNPDLLTLAAKAFRAYQEIPDSMSFTDAGYFWEADGYADGEFRLNDNFLIKNDSVMWLYNQYEIAAYAAGTPEVKLSLQQVLPYLNKNGK